MKGDFHCTIRDERRHGKRELHVVLIGFEAVALASFATGGVVP